ncbi:MAG TPA: VWA domain-containing protein [Thermoanaerobaculia bacterium]|nr:VWA domain-containing protein [Thermoanaerobaculia bacterium]
MIWAEPRWLWGIAAAPLAAAAAGAARSRALSAVRRLDRGFRGRSPWRILLPAAGTALFFAALARPQWGFRRVATASPETDVAILVDTSGSMLARDAAPDRFAAARLFARDALRRLPPTARTAVVRVEGDGEVVCPLTLDRAAAENALEELTPRGADAPGSDLGRGVQTAAALLSARPARTRAIVLVTDGEDLDAGLRAAAAECRRRGILVDTVVAGTESGAAVPSRSGGILMDGGSPVVSHAHAADLAAIAREGGGLFLSAANPSAAAALAASFDPRSASGRGGPVREPVSRRGWPLAAAFAVWAAWWVPRGAREAESAR